MKHRLRQPVSLGYIISAAFFFIAAVLVPNMALADSLRLSVDEDYTSGSLKSTDQSGAQTKTDITDFEQSYNFYMDKNIFPNLSLDAGGLFDRANSDVKVDDFDQHSAENSYNVFGDLKLNVKPFYSSVGYYKRSDTSTTGTSLTNVDERYNGLFSWRPEPDLPSLDLNYTKDFIYDGTRTLTDLASDNLLLGFRYNPSNKIGLTYNLNYIDSLNKLYGSESTTTTHNGNITYGDRFFNNRVNISSTYNISTQSMETIRGSAAESVAQMQLFPVHGLSIMSDTNFPTQTPAMITLNDAPALIEKYGNLTASAGINLGLNSGLVTIPPPPRQEWNIGVDFVTPTQMNTLFVWVNKDLTRVSDLFKWDIYTSSDNVNWTKKFTVTTVPSDFTTLPLPHFIIRFPAAITSRFVKAVVKPLDSVDQTTILVRGLTPSDYNDIYVTEVQPYMFTASTSHTSTSTSRSNLSQQLSINGRAKLLENQDLFYDLSLFLLRNDPGARTTTFLSNALSYSKKFGGIYTLNARAEREDNYFTYGHGTEYQYSAALNVTPFATLSDSLLYSGRHAANVVGNESTTENAIVLANTATLYPGINANLNGGVSFSSLGTGQSEDLLQGSAALTLVPNRKINFNLSYNITSSSLSGGNKRAASYTSYAAIASATYTPFSALYLFGSIQLSEVNSILLTVENYGVNFSPFPGGALQFNFIYNENLGPANNEKSRMISPTLRWNIRPGASLDLTYSIQQSNIAAQTTDARILSSSLQIAL